MRLAMISKINSRKSNSIIYNAFAVLTSTIGVFNYLALLICGYRDR